MYPLKLQTKIINIYALLLDLLNSLSTEMKISYDKQSVGDNFIQSSRQPRANYIKTFQWNDMAFSKQTSEQEQSSCIIYCSLFIFGLAKVCYFYIPYSTVIVINIALIRYRIQDY